MDLEPIILPPDWDEAQDCAYFTDRWTPVPSYTEALWAMARFHYGSLRAAVARALRCAYAQDATLTRIEPLFLPTAERIDVVLESVRRRPRAFDDAPRMLEYLLAAQFAEAERTRVLREYRQAGEGAWMYPVVELIDLCGNVAAELLDTVDCEEEAHLRSTTLTAVSSPQGASSAWISDPVEGLRRNARLGDLTAEQVRLFSTQLEQAHGLSLQPNQGQANSTASSARSYWLRGGVNTVHLAPEDTLEGIWQCATKLRALLDTADDEEDQEDDLEP